MSAELRPVARDRRVVIPAVLETLGCRPDTADDAGDRPRFRLSLIPTLNSYKNEEKLEPVLFLTERAIFS